MLAWAQATGGTEIQDHHGTIYRLWQLFGCGGRWGYLVRIGSPGGRPQVSPRPPCRSRRSSAGRGLQRQDPAAGAFSTRFAVDSPGDPGCPACLLPAHLPRPLRLSIRLPIQLVNDGMSFQ